MRGRPRLRLAALLAALAACGVAVALAGSGGDVGARGGGWERLRPSLLARTEVAAARAGDRIYVVGGFAGTEGSALGATTAAVERYDPRRDRWSRARSMPLALNHPAAATWRGRVYVVGGYTASTGLEGDSAALLRYDPPRDRWARLADMPTARGALAVGVAGDRLYAAGGAAGGRALRTLEVYDLRRDRWRRGPPMPTAREHLAGAVHGGAFYVLAGRSAEQGNVAVAERFVPGRGRWERLPAMRKPRGGIAAAVVGGRIVVVGGEEQAGTIAEVEAYDPARRRWRALPDLPTPRHGLGAVAFGGRVLVLEGGVAPGFSFSRAAEALAPR
jgi:Kelch motif protein/kelch motif-containing protein